MSLLLIIDDDPFDRKMLADAVRAVDGDRTIDEAQDAREGLERARETRPTLIALDLEMPGADGWLFLDAARRIGRTLGPVVVVTTSRREKDHERARALGAADVIAKPNTLEGYKEAAERLLAFV